MCESRIILSLYQFRKFNVAVTACAESLAGMASLVEDKSVAACSSFALSEEVQPKRIKLKPAKKNSMLVFMIMDVVNSSCEERQSSASNEFSLNIILDSENFRIPFHFLCVI